MKIKIIMWLALIVLLSTKAYGNNNSTLDHYRLSYCSDTVFVEACANHDCSSQYTGSANIKIQDASSNGNGNFVDIDSPFIGRVSGKIKENKLEYPFEFQLSSNGNSTNPQAPLRCFVDGIEICVVNDAQQGTENCNEEDNEPLEPSISPGVGYVYGNATIRLGTDSTSVTSATFNASYGGSGSLTYRYGDNAAQPLSGEVALPLNQDILVSFDKAAWIELILQADDDNIAAGSYKTELTFVPRQLKWVNNSTDCGAGTGFNYDDHQQSCQPLAKAGQPIPLTLRAYGEGNRPLTDYSAKIDGIEITELLEPMVSFDQIAVDFSQTSQSQSYSFNSSQAITHVALIRANVPPHCAPYGPQGDDCLATDGDTAILGRTVPASLKVMAREPGQVPGNHLYAGKAVSFSTPPAFTLQAVDINGLALPSFSGEFAGGLTDDNISLELVSDDLALDGTAMPVTVQLNDDGQHRILVSDHEWSFPKGLTPFDARAINEQLELGIHIDSDGIDNQPLTLPWSLKSREMLADNAELRYGQLMISDLTLATETEGTMPVYLHYFNQGGALIEDNGFDFSDQSVSLVALSETDTTLPILTQQNAGIGVDAYAEAAKFQIKAGVEDWLKIPGDEQLLDPTAWLTVTARESALRGYDRVFHRREAIR